MTLRKQLLNLSVESEQVVPRGIPEVTGQDDLDQLSALRQKIDAEDAIQQVVEIAAEEEVISDTLETVIDDQQSLSNIEDIVDQSGEQGISQESYAFVQNHLNAIMKKYGVSPSLPSMESFSGVTTDRRHATAELKKQLQLSQESFGDKIKELIKKFMEWLKTTFNKTERAKRSLLERAKKIKASINKDKEKVDESIKDKYKHLFLNEKGDYESIDTIIHNTFATMHHLSRLKDIVKEVSELNVRDADFIVNGTTLVVKESKEVVEGNGDGFVTKIVLGGVYGKTSRDESGKLSAEVIKVDPTEKGNVEFLTREKAEYHLNDFIKAMEDSLGLEHSMSNITKILEETFKGKENLSENSSSNTIFRDVKTLAAEPWLGLNTNIVSKSGKLLDYIEEVLV